MENQKTKWSRRRFLNTALAGVAGAAVIPHLSGCRGPAAASDEIRLGFIGLGRQAMFLLNGFIQIPGVKVLAGCDVYGIKRKRFENRVSEFYTKAGVKFRIDSYERYQDLLGRKDIDAVIIAVPDHSHAMIAIAACIAGKDVYLEKPMTFTIREGQELRRIVRENNRILGVGSQQRSSEEFKHAVKMVRDGAIGSISRVYAYVGAPRFLMIFRKKHFLQISTGICGLVRSRPQFAITASSTLQYRLILPKMRRYGVHGDGTRKWEAALQLTGVPICSILPSGASVWTGVVR